MKLEIIEDKKNILNFRLMDESKTFAEFLKFELSKHPDIKIATYRIEHPLKGNPEMLIETIKEPVKTIISEVIKKAIKENEKFLKAFEKEVK